MSGPQDARQTVRGRLLLVEDGLSTAFAMREFFTQAGYDVVCASDLEDAMGLLDLHVFDAVITDLHLTVFRSGEGMLVARQARQRSPHTCVVMLTGYGSEATAEEARRCGVNLHLTKPVELAHLRSYINLALDRVRDRARGTGTGN